MKFYLEEKEHGVSLNTGKEYKTWHLFTEDGFEVGVIEPNRSRDSWRNKEYACFYLNGARDSWPSNFKGNNADTVIEARRLLEQYLTQHPEIVEETKKAQTEKDNRFAVKFLPESEENAKGFFPTPPELAGRMLRKVKNLNEIKTVLEPSAGLGDLAKVTKHAITDKYKRNSYSKEIDIDVIEIDGNLQKILKDSFKVVHDDFLTYTTYKRYDLIIMNPPFSMGAEHLLRAMDMQRKTGGQIVCLLNAETIRNPYTHIRQQLHRELVRLGRANFSIDFVSNAFSKAKRKTDVEIAIVSCNFPMPESSSSIFERLEKAEKVKEDARQKSEVVSANKIDAMIQRYKVECSAGLELIREYKAMVPYILTSLKDLSYNRPILELKLDGYDCDENKYLKRVRAKYWTAFFDNDEFANGLTTNIREKFRSSVTEMSDYEFSKFNIEQVLRKMAAELIVGREETILNLFDELSAEHAYYPECQNNIWLFSGWKTNKAHKVNYKCIVPCYGIYTDRSWDRRAFDVYKAYSFLADIEKCLNYLDGKGSVEFNLEKQLQWAAECGKTKNIHCKYFDVTFYKKGTCHITFTNHYVIDVLNIYAANHKSWLPPSYGKKKYDDMTEEERNIIDEFQGKEAYDEVCKNQDIYLYNPASASEFLPGC